MEEEKNLTQGLPHKLIIKFSIPVLIGGIFQQMYYMADASVVGHIAGADAFAAVGVCSIITEMFFTFCFGLAGGTGILISFQVGVKNTEKVKEVIMNGMYVLVIFSLMLSAVGIVFAEQILVLIHTPAEILEDAVLYLRIVSAGLVAVALYNGVCCMLRSMGDSKTPLVCLIGSNILNIVLDIAFIQYFSFGIAGAAMATILAQSVSFLGCVFFSYRRYDYFRITKSSMRIDKAVMAEVLRLGIPLSLQNGMVTISCVGLQSMVNAFGTSVIAAYTATGRLRSFAGQFYIAMNTAMVSYTAQNIGAKDEKRVRAGVRFTSSVILVFSAAAMLLFGVFAREWLSLIVAEQEVLKLGMTGLRIICFFFPAWGMLNVLRGGLNGMGDTQFALVSGAIEIVGRVGIAAVLIRISAVNIWGLWMAEGLTWVLITISGLYYYGKKKK